MKVAILKKSKAVSIEVRIGLAERGSYLVSLWDDKKSTWSELGAGNSWDRIEDKFQIGQTPSQLDGSDLGWKIGIISEDKGVPYAARFTILQEGQPVQGGEFIYSGQMKTDENFERIRGLVRLVVK